MHKLIVFDKDGTLTTPASGGKFVQSPDDQILLPGVAAKLEVLRSDGWKMAIASNQGGCSLFECAPENLKAGMSVYFSDGIDRRQVQSIAPTALGTIFRLGGQAALSLLPHERVLASYKHTQGTHEEMVYAMGLTGIAIGFFCPDMAGETLFSSESVDESPEYLKDSSWRDRRNASEVFRKPSPGMLLAALDWAFGEGTACHGKPGIPVETTIDPTTIQKVFVGDRPEDEGAAIAAGFEFHWANDFFGWE
jgi:histidinol phosphatase-like enzyme